ncbi:MAG: DUF885 domain-containing protein [Bryobacterales bacterium]|nr:DUF885 domain-containing protein [Bryobacterales bacterium]
MLRPLLLLSLLVFTGPAAPAAAGIDEFFERFTADWVRASPELATSTQYFSGTEQVRLDGQLSPETGQVRKERVDRARRGLAEVRRFDANQLSASQRLSARVLEWQLDAIVQSARFEGHHYVFNQGIGAFPAGLVRFLTDIHPARNPGDVENYLLRLSQVASRVDEAIVLARAAAGRGIIPPRFILTATIGQVERLAAPEPGSNVLVASYEERISKSPSISAEDRRKFRLAATKKVADSVVPAFRRVIALLEEQRKTATDDAGLSKLHEGAAAYASRLRGYTSTALTADQIHRTGLEKVAQVEGALDKLLRELGYRDGSVKDRFAKAQDDHSYPDAPGVRTTILADYEKIMREAERRAGSLFDLRPKALVVVRRIPEYAERNAAANYSVSARDGSRPGTFNVPLAGPKFSRLGMRTLAYHEAVPGHHFQVALQQEDKDLPRFRADRIIREGMTAFSEGWGLYAEALALESGWYDDDLPGKLGALDAQLFRAKRLVVDTGLHTKGWTRQQAIDYGISVSEVERYVAAPGQACAYMIGQLKILELRDKARRELGEKFSLPEFHNVVLRTGAVPLEVLEEVVNEYIAGKKPKG